MIATSRLITVIERMGRWISPTKYFAFMQINIAQIVPDTSHLATLFTPVKHIDASTLIEKYILSRSRFYPSAALHHRRTARAIGTPDRRPARHFLGRASIFKIDNTLTKMHFSNSTIGICRIVSRNLTVWQTAQNSEKLTHLPICSTGCRAFARACVTCQNAANLPYQQLPSGPPDIGDMLSEER